MMAPPINRKPNAVGSDRLALPGSKLVNTGIPNTQPIAAIAQSTRTIVTPARERNFKITLFATIARYSAFY